MEFVFQLWNWASHVKAVSACGVVRFNFKDFATCFLLSDSEIIVSDTVHYKLNSGFALAAARVVTAGMLFWRCFYHSQVLVQSVKKQLCPILEKERMSQEECFRLYS